jgi:hypothetical protein
MGINLLNNFSVPEIEPSVVTSELIVGARSSELREDSSKWIRLLPTAAAIVADVRTCKCVRLTLLGVPVPPDALSTEELLSRGNVGDGGTPGVCRLVAERDLTSGKKCLSLGNRDEWTGRGEAGGSGGPGTRLRSKDRDRSSSLIDAVAMVLASKYRLGVAWHRFIIVVGIQGKVPDWGWHFAARHLLGNCPVTANYL